MSKIDLHSAEKLAELFRSPRGKKRIDEFAEMENRAEDVAKALGVSRETFRAAFKIVYSGYSGWRDYVVNHLAMKRYEQAGEEFSRIDAKIREKKEEKERYKRPSYGGPEIKFPRRRVFKKLRP